MFLILRSTYCLFIALAVIWMMPNPSYAVTDTIHGIINICTPVLGIDSCNATIVVKKSYGFKANDRVILIQMQGATISVADDSTYGNLVSLGSAGNYELTTVESVHGNSIQLKYRLERSYDVKGSVQFVRVPHYTGNVVVDSTLTAPKWDGKCGGVLALIVDDTLYPRATIHATGCGFRGGYFTARSDSENQQGYSYSISSGMSGMKGESIVSNSLNTRSGRGKFADGGGGGNANRSGGGGGGNAGAGGIGGNQHDSAIGGPTAIGGKGGASVADTNTSNRLFLGGGGGSGHQNGIYGATTLGSTGGGIIFVRCSVIDLSAFTKHEMASNGGDVQLAVPVSMAGAGGGGGGGTILLDFDSTSQGEDSEYDLVAWGGNGGGISGTSEQTTECMGPGGGGGGGQVMITLPTVPSPFYFHVTGGVNGSLEYGSVGCSTITSYGAESGENGYTRFSVVVVEATFPR
jgi:hypothetical protein